MRGFWIAIGIFVLLVLAAGVFTEAEAGCKKHPKHCHPPVTATVPVPTPTNVVPTLTPTPPIVTPEPEEPIDSCFFHPTNPCVEPTPTVTATATPAPTPVWVPVYVPTPAPTVAPTPVVQLPPSGILPGAPNTGSAGLRAMVDNATPTWCYIVNDVLYCSGKYYGRIWK